jgi:hypothetical protein
MVTRSRSQDRGIDIPPNLTETIIPSFLQSRYQQRTSCAATLTSWTWATYLGATGTRKELYKKSSYLVIGFTNDEQTSFTK